MAGLYIHIPYCKQKCHYCDFHFSVSLRTKDALLEALKKEMIMRKSELTEPIETIYFGGGTPSLLSIYELNDLLDTLYENYPITQQAEISLEANPDDLSPNYLKELAASPINRLSIGVQSFFDADLQFMNRAHTAAEAIQSVKIAKDAGFENITIDLMYGLPNLSQDRWEENLAIFLELDIPHLSAYALTIEHQTALNYFIKSKKIPPLDEKMALKHFVFLQDFLKKNGYWQYELSNFAKEAYLSKHNTSYWRQTPYMGLGPSAHSFDLKSRSWNVSSNTKYIKSITNNQRPFELENLSLTDRYNEYIMTGLRTIWGVSPAYINEIFGLQYFRFFNEKIQTLAAVNKLIKMDFSLPYGLAEHWLISPDFLFIADGIISDLFYID